MWSQAGSLLWVIPLTLPAAGKGKDCISILQIRTLRFREVKCRVPGHTSHKTLNLTQTQALQIEKNILDALLGVHPPPSRGLGFLLSGLRRVDKVDWSLGPS